MATTKKYVTNKHIVVSEHNRSKIGIGTKKLHEGNKQADGNPSFLIILS
jgi:hypothetical protein